MKRWKPSVSSVATVRTSSFSEKKNTHTECELDDKQTDLDAEYNQICWQLYLYSKALNNFCVSIADMFCFNQVTESLLGWISLVLLGPAVRAWLGTAGLVLVPAGLVLVPAGH